MHGKGKMWFNNDSTADGIWEKGLLVEANLKVVSDDGSVEEMKGTFEYQRYCKDRKDVVDWCLCCQNDIIKTKAKLKSLTNKNESYEGEM
jgi:hypothetical protein